MVDGVHIGHHLPQHPRVYGAESCRISVKTQGPDEDGRDGFLIQPGMGWPAAGAVSVGGVIRAK